MALENKVIYYHLWNFGELAQFTEDKINTLFSHLVLQPAFYKAFQLVNGRVLQ